MSVSDEQTRTALTEETREPRAGEPKGGLGRLVAWWGRNRLGRPFWVFLAVSCLFNFGMFMFVLLYNLYLLDRGFKEDFLGWVASCSTVGNIAGTFLAVALNRRVGLQRTVMACFACGALVSAARALVVGEPALLGLALCAGLFFAVWAISITVIVAQVTTPEQRPLAFSVYLATVIGIGVVADPLGGRLPGWLGGAFGASDPAEAKQWALLSACAVIALALIPLSRLRFRPTQEAARATYPRSRFIVRFLVAVALMTLATAAFNPFANAYFARHLQMPVHDIGLIFSAGQFAQVVAILISPLILRRVGVIWGVTLMESAAALSLLFLASGPPGTAAAFGFAGYMAFQWMDEPAMESLLMTRVRPHERSGASSLMYLTIYLASAVAAPAAGFGLARFGYTPVMTTAALLLLTGGLMYGVLLRGFDRDAG
jgi:predicted MFS family arabinose efflux permease